MKTSPVRFIGSFDWRNLEVHVYIRARLDYPPSSSVHQYARKQLQAVLK